MAGAGKIVKTSKLICRPLPRPVRQKPPVYTPPGPDVLDFVRLHSSENNFIDIVRFFDVREWSTSRWSATLSYWKLWLWEHKVRLPAPHRAQPRPKDDAPGAPSVLTYRARRPAPHVRSVRHPQNELGRDLLIGLTIALVEVPGVS